MSIELTTYEKPALDAAEDTEMTKDSPTSNSYTATEAVNVGWGFQGGKTGVMLRTWGKNYGRESTWRTHFWQTEMETWGQEQYRWMEECGGVNSVKDMRTGSR